MNRNTFLLVLAAIAALSLPMAASAQTTVSEDFTGTSTTNSWYFFNGACLTAGQSAGVEPSGVSGGQVPGCVTIYAGGVGPLVFNEKLVGGYNGVAGSSTAQLPDPIGHGSLRFTNGNLAGNGSPGSAGGLHQNGAIVSATPFPTGQGLSVSFKTITYRGDSGGAANDGADGMSFFLMDASQLNTSIITGVASGNGNGLGAWGGSLGYSCSNSNGPQYINGLVLGGYNGLIGGYIGLGIDEYGNFLNGTSNTLSETGTSATGDNTASGGGYQPGRIGLRGAGNIAWAALTGAYGTAPSNPAGPYYPATLAQGCVHDGGIFNSTTGACEMCGAGTTYNPTANMCESCSTGTYLSATNNCTACPAGQTYDATTNTCQSCSTGSYDPNTNNCTSCPAGQTYDSTTQTCQSCPSGETYNAGTNQCEVCSSGSYVSSTGTCSACANGGYWNSSSNQCETCASGVYNSGTNTCYGSCAAGTTWNGNTNTCQSCSGSGHYDTAVNSNGGCYTCNGSKVWVGDIGGTESCCPAGNTYNPLTGKCSGGTTPTNAGAGTLVNANPTTASGSAGITPSTATPNSNASNSSTTNPPLAPNASNPGVGFPDSYYAVQNTCKTGNLFNYGTYSSLNTTPVAAGAASLSNSLNIGLPSSGIGPILDYGAIPSAYTVLPAGTKIANESAMSRGAATPIIYSLKITQNGLLSLSYSINGGAYQQVIKSQSITASNGPLPANFLFGFAGSTGGSSNIHEILCFKATPATTSASGAGASERQSAKLETGAQAFFAFYNPSDWTGRVTASSLFIDTFGNVAIAATPTWDASCVLTGVRSTSTCATTGVSGPITAEAPTSRVMLTWNGTQGVPFEYGNLSAAEESLIDAGDVATNPCSSTTAYANTDRVAYLRGDRTCEINSAGIGLFRKRDYVLGDVIDSSPAWIGPPVAPYPGVWNDRLYSAATNSEDSAGAQTYVQYTAANETRLNMVYVGSNDGFLHGFRAGSYSTSGTFCSTTTAANCSGAVTPNDGEEMLAYMPAAILQSIHNTSNTAVDFSNSQYGHQFFVDATPGTGDLFYNSAWHTWVVGGLGPGGNLSVAFTVVPSGTAAVLSTAFPGATGTYLLTFSDNETRAATLTNNSTSVTWTGALTGSAPALTVSAVVTVGEIYALDVTNPGNFSETPATAASLVMGDWTAGTISCAGSTTPNGGPNCGHNLGNTYGTPSVRRLHNGNWAVIFGNGIGSASGDAGIYVMTVNPTTAATTFYYLSTGKGSLASPNGIAFASPVDLDGDHITDYVYAGDLQGNVWRFDLTSSNASQWAVTPGPLFTAPSGQPITTAIVAASGSPYPGMSQYLMLLFGTGEKFPLTNVNPATYASGTQSLYGVWDWNMTGWNSISTSAQYAALTAAASGLTATNNTMSVANLQAQTVTINAATGNRDIMTNAQVCWKATSTCSSNNNSFGWYLNLPGSGEQIVYSPELVQQALTVNSLVPATNDPTSCALPLDTGFTYVLSAMTGAAFNQVFLPPSEAAAGYSTNPAYADANAIAMQTNATGSSFITGNSSGTMYLVYETNLASGSGTGAAIQGGTLGLNLPPNTTGRRISWVERR